jgi:phosphonate degradation associated HDIG domain protein
MKTPDPAQIVKQLIDLYARLGTATYGEHINQTEHAVQCARLAQQSGADAELITAALLHDIGHLLDAADGEHGNFKHDSVGASFLARDFSPAVSEPVRLHAQAKRYLCTVETGYYACLSPASVFSLEKQGGLMSADEVQAFEHEPYFESAVALRRWDDQGKDVQLSSGSVAAFEETLHAALAACS